MQLWDKLPKYLSKKTCVWHVEKKLFWTKSKMVVLRLSCTFSEFVDAALILLVKSSISESRSSSFALAHQFDPVVKQNAIKAHQCPHQ